MISLNASRNFNTLRRNAINLRNSFAGVTNFNNAIHDLEEEMDSIGEKHQKLLIFLGGPNRMVTSHEVLALLREEQ